jgi:hypothetical protein
VLVEDGPNGGPIVTRAVDAASQRKKPGTAAHHASPGIPELPKSTPGPVLDTKSEPRLDGGQPIEEPVLYRLDRSSEDGLSPVPGPQPSAAHSDDVEVTELPRSRLAALADATREHLLAFRSKLQSARMAPRPRGRPQWFWPAVVVPALAVGAGIVALARSVAGTDRKADETTTSTPSGRSSSAPSMPVALPGTPAEPRPGPPPALGPCAVAGVATAIAPSAIVAAGVEVRPFGGDVAVGFARNDHEAVGVRLSPTSLAATFTARSRSKDPIRRVRPIATAKGSLVLAVDADRKGDPLTGRRTLPIDPPLQVGASGTNLVWSRPGGRASGTLWPISAPISADEDVDALRGATEGAPGDTTTVIAFRRGGALWLGTATGYKALAPRGDLARVDGLGSTIGSPAVALNDGVALAAWADRASSGDSWRLRWVRFKAGDPPGAARTFTPPASVQNGPAMSPGLAAVPGGRFLLVWTEGSASFHHVRALTLSEDGAPVGPPLEISADGANAGEGQAAVGAGGRGLVAFLESQDGGYRIAATPIACGE